MPGAASAATVTLPDLQVKVPTGNISIGTNPDTGHRQLQFTHITWDAGTGPFAIQPSYSASSDLSSFSQVLYNSPSPGAWTVDHRVQLGVDGIFEPPSDYRYPLTRFSLDSVGPGGANGSVLRVSPKVDYCITGDTYVGGVANTPETTSPPQSDCAGPNLLLGWSVGWGDQYDQTDNGQPIDLTGVANGTYVLHAVVDPQHVFTESDRNNDVTDTTITISNDQVTVLSQSHPRVVPPTVSVTSPASGVSVHGTVTLEASATATAPSAVSAVQYLLDGVALGPKITVAPFRFAWASGPNAGTHSVSAQVFDTSGSVATATPITVHVTRTTPAGLGVDALVTSNGHGVVRAVGLTTSSAPETIVALCALDGPSGARQWVTVSGAGLAWHLARRSNAQAGDAEIWTATSSKLLSRSTVISTPHVGGYAQKLTVMAYAHAAGPASTGASSAAVGAPIVRLVTKFAGSIVVAVGSDWDHAIARTPALGQTIWRQWVDAGDGDTFWVQGPPSTTSSIGARVAVSDSAPATDRYDMVSVEVRAASQPAPSVAIASPAPGEVVSGRSPVAIAVRDGFTLRSLRISVDGRRSTAAVRGAQFWSTTIGTSAITNGRHVIVASGTDSLGRTMSSSVVVLVANPRPAMTCFVLSAIKSAGGLRRATLRALRVSAPGERLVAIVRGAPGIHPPVITSWPRFPWRLLVSSSGPAGSVSAFSASAPAHEGTVAVTAVGAGAVALTVFAIEGTGPIGSVASRSSATGGTLAMRTREPTSLILAAGVSARYRVPFGWVSLSSVPVGAVTSWVQYTNVPVRSAGTNVLATQASRARGPWAAIVVELPGDDG
jgi:hypothetical protein